MKRHKSDPLPEARIREEQPADSVQLQKRKLWAAAVLIFIITFVVYSNAIQHEFLNWDDDEYVYRNIYIQSIDLSFFKWIMTEFHSANWHPVTWVSHALDYRVWGLDPSGHHISGIIIHCLNAVLVFILCVLLVRAAESLRNPANKTHTDLFARAVIAGTVASLLLGIHPVHAESVAWVSQRKNLLSTFFVLLSLIFYCKYLFRYEQDRRYAYYSACFLFFVLAVMSKPKAITLPFMLLILDIYPFGRFESRQRAGEQKWIIIEKLPFFLIGAFVSILTVMAQHGGGAIRSVEAFPLHDRLLTALRGLYFYIEKMLLPFNLSPFYPFPDRISLMSFTYALPALFVISASILSIFAWRRGKKIFAAVWLYYVITLIPVLGIIQIGSQSTADRYAYLPCIGPFMLAGIGSALIYERIKGKRYLFLPAPGVLLFAFALYFSLLSFQTLKQIHVWKDSVTLWSRVISMFPEYPDAYLNRANARIFSGNYDEALIDFGRAIELKPDYAAVYNNRGLAHKAAGKYHAAISDFTRAAELSPGDPAIYNNRADVYLRTGRHPEALADLDKAIELGREDAGFYINRCILHNNMGSYNKAIRDCTAAVTLSPGNPAAYSNRALAYFAVSDLEKSVADFGVSIAMDPDNPDLFFSRGIVYRDQGEYQKAIEDFVRATELNPHHMDAYINSGVLLAEAGRFEHAIDRFTAAIRVNPQYAAAHYNRGVVYYRMSNKEKALADFRTAAGLGDKEVRKILKSRGITW